MIIWMIVVGMTLRVPTIRIPGIGYQEAHGPKGIEVQVIGTLGAQEVHGHDVIRKEVLL